jgi:aminoglycoside 3-N-acetyltransferase
MATIKKKLKIFLKACWGPRIGPKAIAVALKGVGLEKSGHVIMHSALSKCGYLVGGGEALVKTVREYTGPDSTLVLPAHSGKLVSNGLRTFDQRHTPSRVGAVAEWFRNQPLVKRSLHPTHSVAALGPDVDSLLSGHENAQTPCGRNSPYHRLLELDASILLLGAPLESNTSYHCCEGLMELPYLLRPEKIEFRFLPISGEPFSKALAIHQPRIPRNLQLMNQELSELGILKSCKLGSGWIHRIQGKPFMEYLCDRLKKDNEFLLADKSSGSESTR